MTSIAPPATVVVPPYVFVPERVSSPLVTFKEVGAASRRRFIGDPAGELTWVSGISRVRDRRDPGGTSGVDDPGDGPSGCGERAGENGDAAEVGRVSIQIEHPGRKIQRGESESRAGGKRSGGAELEIPTQDCRSSRIGIGALQQEHAGAALIRDAQGADTGDIAGEIQRIAMGNDGDGQVRIENHRGRDGVGAGEVSDRRRTGAAIHHELACQPQGSRPGRDRVGTAAVEADRADGFSAIQSDRARGGGAGKNNAGAGGVRDNAVRPIGGRAPAPAADRKPVAIWEGGDCDGEIAISDSGEVEFTGAASRFVSSAPAYIPCSSRQPREKLIGKIAVTTTVHVRKDLYVSGGIFRGQKEESQFQARW